MIKVEALLSTLLLVSQRIIDMPSMDMDPRMSKI